MPSRSSWAFPAISGFIKTVHTPVDSLLRWGLRGSNALQATVLSLSLEDQGLSNGDGPGVFLLSLVSSGLLQVRARQAKAQEGGRAAACPHPPPQGRLRRKGVGGVGGRAPMSELAPCQDDQPVPILLPFGD